jgi:hypothetical protein
MLADLTGIRYQRLCDIIGGRTHKLKRIDLLRIAEALQLSYAQLIAPPTKDVSQRNVRRRTGRVDPRNRLYGVYSLLVQHDLTLNELAARIGYNENYTSEVIRGIVKPSSFMLDCIATVFNVTVEQLKQTEPNVTQTTSLPT